MAIHKSFRLIEEAAERGNESAVSAKLWISEVIREAFQLVNKGRPDRHSLRGLRGFTLSGADSCERVAEALAVWLEESNPLAFAEMTGTRYQVNSLDCSADGMERLRNQSEFILLAYPSEDSTPESLCAEWLQDMNATGHRDGFDYEAAEQAVRSYVTDATESGYLAAKIAEAASYAAGCNESGLPADEWDGFESAPFRLYVEDSHADAAEAREAAKLESAPC